MASGWSLVPSYRYESLSWLSLASQVPVWFDECVDACRSEQALVIWLDPAILTKSDWQTQVLGVMYSSLSSCALVLEAVGTESGNRDRKSVRIVEG